MIWMGMKCSSRDQIHSIQDYICDELSKRYEEVERNKRGRCFLLDSGEVITITCMINEKFNHIVTEYADNVEEMKKNNTTDGSLYYLDDYETAEDMLKDIVAEIEQTK